MKNRIPALIAGLALGGSLLLAGAGATLAASPAPGGNSGPSGNGPCATQAAAVKAGATVDNLHAFADCEISRRFTTLDDLSSKISGAKALTSGDASALSAEVSSTKFGLTTLKATIDAETNIPALRADIVKIATDYRVYLLVVPQVNLVIGADTVVSLQSKAADINTALSAKIAEAKAAGKNTSAAEADLATANTDFAKAIAAASPLPAQLLPLTPAQYNAGSAGPVITAARPTMGGARDDVKAAVAAAKACRDELAKL